MTDAGSAGARFDRFAAAVLRRPRRVVAAFAAALALALAATPAVRFTGDVARLLPPDHPHLLLSRLLDERARPQRVLWLLLEGDGAAATVPEVAASLRRSPFLLEVDARREDVLGGAAGAAAGGGGAPVWQLDDRGLDALAARLSPAGRADAVAEILEQLADDPIGGRELAVRDPLGVRTLLHDQDPAARLGLDPTSPFAVLRQSGAALLRLVGTADASAADFATALMDDVERRLQGRAFSAYGGYAIARAEARRMREDLQSSSVWSLVLALGFLALSMRSVLLPALVLLPAVLALVLAVPFAAALFGPLPAIAVAAAAVLIGLGDDFAIHWLAQYRALRQRLGHDAAVSAAHARAGPELVLDALATAGAFLVLAASELQGLLVFGLLLAIGLALCLVAVLALLPLLLRLPWLRDARPERERSRVAELADRWGRTRAGRGVAALTLLLAAASGGLLLVRGVPLTADPLALRPRDDEQQQVRHRLERELGVDTLPALLLWPERDGLDGLDRLLHALRDEGRVVFWNGLSRSEVPSVRRRVAALREAALPALAAFPGELREHGLVPGPFEPALDALRESLSRDDDPAPPMLVELDGTRWRAVQVFAAGSLAGGGFDAFAAAVEREAARAAGAPDSAGSRGPRVRVHGSPRLERDLERVLRADLLRTSLLALGLTAVLVGAFTRSLRHGLLALLPSAIGTALTLGAASLLGAPLTLVSFVAVPLLLGIGVDEGVHVVGRLRHADTLGATGVAVVRSTTTSVLAFAALAAVPSPGLAGLGRLVACGMAVTLLASLFVLPPLLLARRGHDDGRS